MIITIDGPAGAGKSTVARRLADRLGWAFLDTGAMYRAVTWEVIRRGIDVRHEALVAQVAREIQIEFDGERVLVDGQDLTSAIRHVSIAQSIGPVADNPGVRHHLVRCQRHLAAFGNYVCEGRDQGTEAFPDAICKIFLTASPTTRAERRLRELESKQQSIMFEEVLTQQTIRDQQDANRPVGALRKAVDAIEINTDGRELDQVVDELWELAVARIAAPTNH